MGRLPLAAWEKGYDYWVDDQNGSGTFSQTYFFSEDQAGLFDVAAGTNTIGAGKGLGLVRHRLPRIPPVHAARSSPVPATLCDSSADANTQTLMNYLVSQYGSKTLSGQQANAGEDLFPTQDYLNRSGGVVPGCAGRTS